MKTEKKYYHGSRVKGLSVIDNINNLKKAGITVVGSTDADRQFFTDKVFITSSRSLASQYAGKAGVVYTVRPVNVELYSELYRTRAASGQIKKKSKKTLLKKIKKLQKNNSVFVADFAVVVMEGK